MPQTSNGHKPAVARRFGLDEPSGTPNLLVLIAGGVPIHAGTATTWRNAASRSEEAIVVELERLADAPV
ncbi:MAG: hypothetical protein ACOCYR_08685 [Erythrobacter sp.]